MPGIKIKVLFDSSTDYSFAYVPFAKKSKSRIINIPLTSIDQSISEQTGSIDIRTAIRDHIDGKRLIKEICFAHGSSNCPYVRFIGDAWILDKSTLTKFSAKSFKQGRRYNRFFNTYRWSACRFQYYEGEFDSQGKKQGNWVWYFSNKKPMIKADFINDSLVDGMESITMYNFLGDTIQNYYY